MGHLWCTLSQKQFNANIFSDRHSSVKFRRAKKWEDKGIYSDTYKLNWLDDLNWQCQNPEYEEVLASRNETVPDKPVELEMMQNVAYGPLQLRWEPFCTLDNRFTLWGPFAKCTHRYDNSNFTITLVRVYLHTCTYKLYRQASCPNTVHIFKI